MCFLDFFVFQTHLNTRLFTVLLLHERQRRESVIKLIEDERRVLPGHFGPMQAKKTSKLSVSSIYRALKCAQHMVA